MKRLTLIACTTLAVGLFSSSSFSQNSSSVRNLDSTSFASQIHDLRVKYGENKFIDSTLELATLVAMKHVGNLDKTKIKIKYASIGTSLNARPTVASLLFRNRKHRKYVIRVNDKSKGKIPLVSDANFNATVGVLGHELCHIKDYSDRRFGGVMKRLFAYGSKKSKEKFEKEIDSMTIWSGLGWQAFDWESFVQNSPVSTEKYKAFKREIYFEAKEIEELIITYNNTLLK